MNVVEVLSAEAFAKADGMRASDPAGGEASAQQVVPAKAGTRDLDSRVRGNDMTDR